MHILLTNDDGIHAIGLKALADAAIRRGHSLIISAPATQCSANSQHITLAKPLLVHPVNWPGASAFAVDGTPSDCARLGPHLTRHKIDVCISGINRGENTGAGIYYSGTVAAARDAAMLYIPAIASSIMAAGTEAGLQALADFTIRAAERINRITFPRCGVLNINAPSGDPDTWGKPTVCPMSHAYFLDSYEKRISPLGQTYFWLGGKENSDPDALNMEQHEPGSDADMLRKGYITLSMLSEYTTMNDCIPAAFTAD